MSVSNIRSAFIAAQTARRNDTISAKEIRTIVEQAKKDDNVFEPAEKAEIARLATDAIANRKMSAAGQAQYARLQRANGIHDDRPRPLWMGNVYTVIERSGEAGKAVANPIVYDGYARQRAATRELRFEAWLPGMTNVDDPELYKKLDAKVHFRFAGEKSFHEAPIDIKRRSGSNTVYAMNLERFDPWDAPFIQKTAVKGLEPRLETTPSGNNIAKLEAFFTINGERFDNEGQTFKVNFENAAPLPRPGDAWR